MAAGPRLTWSGLLPNLVVTLWAGSLALVLILAAGRAVVGLADACVSPAVADGQPAQDASGAASPPADPDAAGTASDAPTEAVDGDQQPQLTQARPGLEPVGTQPVPLPMGRAREVRYARAMFTLIPVTPSGDAAAQAATDQSAGDDQQNAQGGSTAALSEDATAAAPRTSPPSATVEPDLAGLDAREYLDVEIGLFRRDNGAVLGGRPVRPEAGTRGDVGDPPLVASAWSRRGVVIVELCVDRSGPSIGSPGTYTGSGTVVDPRVARTEVPFVVTLSYPHSLLLVALLYVVVVVAAVYVWMAREGIRGEAGFEAGRFAAWLRTRSGMLTVGSGAVATYVAYSATYLAAATWGESILQVGALVGAGFTAFITAATAVIAAAPSADRDRRDADTADDRASGAGG